MALLLSIISLVVCACTCVYLYTTLKRLEDMLTKPTERPTEGSMKRHFEPVLVYNKLVRSKEIEAEEKT